MSKTDVHDAVTRFTEARDDNDRVGAALEVCSLLQRPAKAWEWPTDTGSVVFMDHEISGVVAAHVRDGEPALGNVATAFSRIDPQSFGQGFVERLSGLHGCRERIASEIAKAAASGLAAYVAAGLAVEVRP